MEYQSTEIGELAKALAAAQGEMDAAKKDNKGNYGKYTTISSILEVVKDALSKNGLAVVQAPMPCEAGNICLRTTLMHTSGQWIASELSMKAENVSPQKIGSVITYARRYALAALLGVGQEDDDAQAAQDAYERQARKAQREAIQQDRKAASANNPDAKSRNKALLLRFFEAARRGRSWPDQNSERETILAEVNEFFGLKGDKRITTSNALTDAQMNEYIEACSTVDSPF